MLRVPHHTLRNCNRGDHYDGIFFTWRSADVVKHPRNPKSNMNQALPGFVNREKDVEAVVCSVLPTFCGAQVSYGQDG